MTATVARKVKDAKGAKGRRWSVKSRLLTRIKAVETLFLLIRAGILVLLLLLLLLLLVLALPLPLWLKAVSVQESGT